jgi:hypothetical protein
MTSAFGNKSNKMSKFHNLLAKIAVAIFKVNLFTGFLIVSLDQTVSLNWR